MECRDSLEIKLEREKYIKSARAQFFPTEPPADRLINKYPRHPPSHTDTLMEITCNYS